jgi:hypothetical protein
LQGVNITVLGGQYRRFFHLFIISIFVIYHNYENQLHDNYIYNNQLVLKIIFLITNMNFCGYIVTIRI